MSRAIKTSRCVCALSRDQPRTLDAIQKQGKVSFLDGDLGTLALIGTQLADALISTNNGAALLSGMGGLAPYQDTAKPFRVSQNRVTLRVQTNTPVRLARTDGRMGSDSALVVMDASETVSLRFETDGGYDTRVLRSLGEHPQKSLPSVDVATQDGVISLAAVRSAREGWATSDSGQHLNDICQDGGRARFITLSHVGRSRAWPIQKQVILSFLSFLVNRNTRHVRLVPGHGFIQGDVFRQGSIQLLDQIAFVSGERTNFAIDLSQITSCWVTRFRAVSHLELYGEDSKAIAVFAPDPNSDIRHWNELLASLPARSA